MLQPQEYGQRNREDRTMGEKDAGRGGDHATIYDGTLHFLHAAPIHER
jgi:hypothetical protein